MIRNIKALGLALVAVLALSALAASPASAFTKWFKSTAEHTLLVGAQEGTDEFVTAAGTVKCGNATYSGSVQSAEKKVETIKITPVYSECTVSGVPASVTMNGCYYIFHTERETPGPKTDPAYVDIECTDTITGAETGPIVIHASLFGTNKCTITVPEQTNLSTTNGEALQFTHKGEGSTTELEVDVHLTDIHYTSHAGTGIGACASKATGTDATYVGRAKITGKNTSNEHVAISYGE